MINYKDILKDPNIIDIYNQIEINNTTVFDHSLKHIKNVCNIMNSLCNIFNITGAQKDALLIAASLHDIGAIIERNNHGLTGSIYAAIYLKKYEFGLNKYYEEIISAIKYHSDYNKMPDYSKFVNLVCLADKLDFSKKRVRPNINESSYKSIEKINISYDNNTLTIDILSKKNLTYLELYKCDYFQNKTRTIIKNACQKLGINYIIKFNNLIKESNI